MKTHGSLYVLALIQKLAGLSILLPGRIILNFSFVTLLRLGAEAIQRLQLVCCHTLLPD